MYDLLTVKSVAKLLKVNTEVLSIKTLQKGMNVEAEHGSRFKKLGLDISYDSPIISAKIALAHIEEFPDYYDRLEVLEKSAKKYWKHQDKPNIFL